MAKILFVCLGLLLISIACTPNDSIPKEVLLKYGELSEQYKDSLGASLSRCVKGDTVIYDTVGDGGYTGISYYHNAGGMFIESRKWSDVPELDSNGNIVPHTQPIINIYEYNCTEILRSK